MSYSFACLRTPLTAVIVTVLLAGCGYHSEYHAAGIAPHRSIKDDPAPAAERGKSRPAPVHKVALREAPRTETPARSMARSVPDMPSAPTTARPLASDIAPIRPTARIETPAAPANPAVTRPALTPLPKTADTPAAPAPVAVAAGPPVVVMPPPVIAPPVVKSEPTTTPAAVATPPPPPPSPVASSTIFTAPAKPPVSPPAQRPTIDQRRAPAPVIAAAPPPAPPATPPSPAVIAAPVPDAAANKISQPIIIQPKAPSAATDPAASVQPKVAALTDEQRVRDTINRAQEYMRTSRMINARTLLQDAGRDNNPSLMTALAETYDPLYLRDNHPRLARAAEATRALDLYRQASQRGSVAATTKLEKLGEFLKTNPGLVRPQQ